jgi:hypothetical protein
MALAVSTGPLAFAWLPPRAGAAEALPTLDTVQTILLTSSAAPRRHVAQVGTVDGHHSAQDPQYRVCIFLAMTLSQLLLPLMHHYRPLPWTGKFQMLPASQQRHSNDPNSQLQASCRHQRLQDLEPIPWEGAYRMVLREQARRPWARSGIGPDDPESKPHRAYHG